MKLFFRTTLVVPIGFILLLSDAGAFVPRLRTPRTSILRATLAKDDGNVSTPSHSSIEEKAEIPYDLLWSRMLDTVEDVLIHANRIPCNVFGPDATSPDATDDTRETIVILGSGWAAHALMKVADTSKLRIVVVSPANHFVFTPMLASAAVGTVEPRSLTEAIRSANPAIEKYIQGQAVDVDLDKKVIKVQESQVLDGVRQESSPIIEIPYDKLVVSVGCKVADHWVPGSKEHCLRLKTIEDARRIRSAINGCLELASRPEIADSPELDTKERQRRQMERKRRATFSIIGGGPTGLELAGELTDFVQDVSKGAYAHLKGDISVVLFEGLNTLVPQFEPALRDHALKRLRERGVKVHLETKVLEVGETFLKYAPMYGGDEEQIETGLSIWAAGTAPVAFINTLLEKLPEEAHARGGRVAVDPWMRCKTPSEESFGSVLILGDAAEFTDKQKGNVLPQTAQVAGQQGAFMARLLSRDYDLSATPPHLDTSCPLIANWLSLRGITTAPGFQFLNLGQLAYEGGGQALTQIRLGDFPLADYAGSSAFLLWKSVYLVKQVSLRNRYVTQSPAPNSVESSSSC